MRPVSYTHLAADADEDMTEKFYDELEAAGVEIDVSDVLEVLGKAPEAAPTEEDLKSVTEEALVEDPEALADTFKPVSYTHLGGIDHVFHQRVDALLMRLPQHCGNGPRNVCVAEDAGPHGVVDIMVDVGNTV